MHEIAYQQYLKDNPGANALLDVYNRLLGRNEWFALELLGVVRNHLDHIKAEFMKTQQHLADDKADYELELFMVDPDLWLPHSDAADPETNAGPTAL